MLAVPDEHSSDFSTLSDGVGAFGETPLGIVDKNERQGVDSEYQWVK